MLFFLLWKGYHMSLLMETATCAPSTQTADGTSSSSSSIPKEKKTPLLIPLPKPPSSTWGHTSIQKMATFCNFPRTQRQPASGGLRRLQPSRGLPSRPLMSWQVDKLWIQMLHSQTCIWTYIFLYSSIRGKYFLTFAFTFCFFVLF